MTYGKYNALNNFYLGAAIVMLLNTIVMNLLGHQMVVWGVDLIYGSLLLIRNICWPDSITLPYGLAINYALGLIFIALAVSGLAVH